MQLVMLLSVFLPEDTEKKMKVLIDTGAQANLIRMGTVPDSLFSVSTDPLNLRMANGQRLEGGRRVVETNLGFRQVLRGEMMPSYFWRGCQVYEADITVYAILSFPWLQENCIGVFAHLRASATLEPEFCTLLGVTRRSRAVYHSPEWVGVYCEPYPTPYEGGGSNFNRPAGRTRRRRWAQVQPVVNDPWDEEEEELIMEVEKMRLHIPPVEPSATLDFLSEEELNMVAQRIGKRKKIGW
jgi:hypothetical protein